MAFLKKAALAVRFIGVRQALRTVWYALYRDLRSIGVKKSPIHPPLAPDLMAGWEQVPGGVNVRFAHGISLEVCALGRGVYRLTWLPGSLPYSGLYGEGEEGLRADSEIMTMRIAEGMESALSLSAGIDALTIHPDGRTTLAADGAILCEFDPPCLSGDVWSISKTFRDQEHVYGLGMRAAALNLRGGRYRLWNRDPGGTYSTGSDPLYVTIPVLTSLHPTGACMLFFENPHPGEIDLSGAALTARFEGGALRLYLFTGQPADLLHKFTALTGRPELPPRWALGFHQSRWGYQSEADLRAVLAGFEQHALPLQAIHQDIDYMCGFRVFTVDSGKYPDLPGLIEEMAMRSIRFVPIIDPGIKIDPQFPTYTSGLENDAYVRQKDARKPARAVVWPGWSAFPDFANPKTRKWWSALYQGLIEQGAAGFWHDMNEPAAIAAWGDPTLPPDSTHQTGDRTASHAEIHNIYGHLMNMSGHQALRTARPDRRPWLLSRSGWAGSQRYAWHWTADIESSWEALRLSIPMILNLGLSGYAFTGPDIGGFSGDPGAELYTRWFQMAALLPFFRNHAARGTSPREPWVFGRTHTKIIRDSMLLRQKLMPYLYTLAWEASRTGAPLVRPLFWDHPENQELWDVDDVYLLGPDLFVIPVVEPGQKTRRFMLPPGRWYYFWSDFCITDADQSELPVSLQRIPIFVRGGAILPLEEEGGLVLHVYPDAVGDARGQVYFDEGDGYGPGGTASFQARLDGGECRVSLRIDGGMPLPWPDLRVALHGSDATVHLDR